MENKLKPLGWGPSIVLLLAAAGILRAAHYGFAAGYKQATGNPYLVGYLVAWVGTMALVFAASLTAYKAEGRPFNKAAFTKRYRLEKLERVDWLWTLAMIVFAALSLAALSFTQPLLKTLPFFAPHPAFPPDMVDIFNGLTPGVLFEMPLRGKWWIVGVYLLGWLLNIAGGGVLVPRLDAAPAGGRLWPLRLDRQRAGVQLPASLPALERGRHAAGVVVCVLRRAAPPQNLDEHRLARAAERQPAAFHPPGSDRITEVGLLNARKAAKGAKFFTIFPLRSMRLCERSFLTPNYRYLKIERLAHGQTRFYRN